MKLYPEFEMFKFHLNSAISLLTFGFGKKWFQILSYRCLSSPQIIEVGESCHIHLIVLILPAGLWQGQSTAHKKKKQVTANIYIYNKSLNTAAWIWTKHRKGTFLTVLALKRMLVYCSLVGNKFRNMPSN